MYSYDLTEAPMPTWTDKVERLRQEQDRTYASLERLSGWPVNSLSGKLRDGNQPRARDGIRLARSLGVTAEWLFDDNLGFGDLPAIVTVEHKAPAPNKKARKKTKRKGRK